MNTQSTDDFRDIEEQFARLTPEQRADLDKAMTDDFIAKAFGPSRAEYLLREDIESAVAHLNKKNVGYHGARSRDITFRNDATGETVTVPSTPATRALAERQHETKAPRAERRAQERLTKRLLKKTRKALARSS